MQAFNLDLVDAYLLDLEQQILREYYEQDEWPAPDIHFLSALSQLWVLGLYEILRTWRQSVNEALKFSNRIKAAPRNERQKVIADQKEGLKDMVGDPKDADIFYYRHYKPAEKNAPSYAYRLQSAFDLTEDLFHRIEALRIMLAKHEVPTRKRQYARAPGYGRINEVDGSIFWQISLGENEVDQISHREISDMCREILKRRKRVFIPPSLRQKVRNVPRLSYAYRLITVSVRDGAVFPGVLVRWGSEVLKVDGHFEIPFRGKDIIDAGITVAGDVSIGQKMRKKILSTGRSPRTSH